MTELKKPNPWTGLLSGLFTLVLFGPFFLRAVRTDDMAFGYFLSILWAISLSISTIIYRIEKYIWEVYKEENDT